MFPENFLWGVSEAGFQFEMGDPLGKNIDPNTDWFKWVHDTVNVSRRIVSGDLPENGVNYWELYDSDHDLAEELGMNAYRLGVEWSRIFPRDTAGARVDVEIKDGRIVRIDFDEKVLEKLEALANMDALNHYKKIIENLRDKGFKVIVCLNHFTLPIWIHDPIVARNTGLRSGARGWYDQKTIVEFSKYAGFLAWRLGDKVDIWATFNEPNIVAETGYFLTTNGFPPGVRMNALNALKTFKRVLMNMIVAHARAFEAIKKFDTQRADPDSSLPASVGVIQHVIPVMPLNPLREADSHASRFIRNVHNNLFVEAVSSGWVDKNLNMVRDGDEVEKDLNGKLDWLGVNYYTRMVVKGRTSLLAKLLMGIRGIPEIMEGYGLTCRARDVSHDGRPTSDFGWELYPEGLVETLLEMSRYGRPMFITENGVADSEDRLRPRYIVEHLRVLEEIVSGKRVDVRGYFHWALTDNYEWAQGFSMKFGLYSVNLNTKKRIPRKNSVETLRRIIQNRTVGAYDNFSRRV